ncbi:MAG: WD40 repeat domain-containing protein, partial [Planctomycetota bacterium]
VVGGSFTQAGGSPANSIARWNGEAWSSLCNGIDQPLPFGGNVQALAVLPNGDLIAAGGFPGASGVAASNIARWNGATWSPLGTGCNSPVRCLAVAPNGDLFATGSFTLAGGVACAGIARWNGTAWSALGSGLGLFGGQALAALPNGDIVVGGSFLTAGGGTVNRVARWNGSVWTALGTGLSGVVTALAAHPNGELIVGGTFATAGSVTANNLARWNGATWQPFGAGCDASVLAVGVLGDGALAVGGDFAQAGGLPAGRLAQLTSSCAPTLLATGNGCAGAAGVPTLTVVQFPLLGGSYRSRSARAASPACRPLGCSATALPLALALPQAGAGCTVFASPDVLDALVPTAGAANYALSLPTTAALVGTALHQQFVPLEFDLGFNLIGASASNAVRTTIGTF